MDSENKEDISYLEKQKWYHYNMYKEYESKLQRTVNDIQSKCNHEWVNDMSQYCEHTVYTCKKCGK
jgi:hypothetical protein